MLMLTRFWMSNSSLTLLLTMGWGCSGNVSDPQWPDPVECQGTVTWNGKPLPDAAVLFIPDERTQGRGGSALTDSDGFYTVNSRGKGGDIIPGIVPGKYKVAFSRMINPDGTVWTPDEDNSSGPATVGAREGLPVKYSDPGRSKLIVTINEGGPTQDFVLKK